MAKAEIVLKGCRSHTRGAKQYFFNRGEPTSDPEEIAYCQARPDLFTVRITEEVAKEEAPEVVEPEAPAVSEAVEDKKQFPKAKKAARRKVRMGQ